MSACPDWFTRAVADSPRTRSVDVDGCSINVLSWGDPDAPGLVLVHGGGAHAEWWSFIGPQLASRFHVAAIDLSGHGDSGHRDDYSMETWSDEVVAAAEALHMDKPIVVGHSMGGFVTIVTAVRHAQAVSGVIVVDSPVRRPDPESDEAARGRSFSNPKTYPTLEQALGHFHLVPPQPCENAFAVEHIARHSLHETVDGWTWKFDRHVFDRAATHSLEAYLAMVETRISLLYGQHSAIVTPDVIDYMSSLLGEQVPIVEIPDAHHHVPLDQPLALVTALRALLADWEHSIPTQNASAASAADELRNTSAPAG